MAIHSTIGYNTQFTNVIKWSADNKSIYYPAGRLLVKMQVNTEDISDNENGSLPVKQSVLLRHLKISLKKKNKNL